MKLPFHYEELVDRVWAALHTGPHQHDVALISKGFSCDIVDGLSDIDLRLLFDTASSEVWDWVDEATSRVFIDFAHEHPDSWRIVEHTAGRGAVMDELHYPAMANERLEWELLYEDRPGMVPASTATDERVQNLYLEKFFAYREPYDARRDPPINIAAVDGDRFSLFSVCWHYYAPALRCAAVASGRNDVRSKRDALRWRAESVDDVAAFVMRAAEDGFRQPVGDVAARCSEDILDVAGEVAGADDPWRSIAMRLSTAEPSQAEQLALAAMSGRMVRGRWQYYIDSPEGFDVAGVLRIDRGHLNTYLVGPILAGTGREILRGHAPDVDRHDASVDFLMAQHRETDPSKPREAFRLVREHYSVVRQAIDRWYASES